MARPVLFFLCLQIHHEVHLAGAARDGSERFWAAFDIEVWLRTGCCALLRSERAMQRVMDKLCTGMNIVPLVKAVAVDYLQSAENRFGQGFKDAGVTMTEDGELRMVNRAIEQVVYETMQKKPARIMRCHSSPVLFFLCLQIHHEVHLAGAARDGSERFWAAFDIEVWLRTGCCALLRSERAMQRVMDKLCTGMNIVPLVKAVAVDYLQSAENRFGQGFKDAGVTMTEDGELRMVNRAIEQVVYETMQKKPARIGDTRSRSTIS
ncbi:hypothetical protein ANCCAN_20632 [Ancylostoma caninum]|uniref:Uncharacterized protein n=1 Tax=Ancylostoma caninum TaxID=29170 RepID=A0A368FMS3_ANCCA|nr:hypothetical protein ANCCAN_20632 [Ancylostoma caninum]